MANKKYYNFLIFACTFLWVMMMGSKNVYTAELVEIGNIFNVNKSQASLAMTYYFVTYSIAQIVLFFFMDNINLKWFMTISIFLSGIVTVFVAFMTSMWSMWWLLAFNGILQAGVWGICLAVLKKYLPLEMMPKANVILNIGTAIAGIISYGFSAVFVSIGKWNLPFIILGAILSLSAILFLISVNAVQKLQVQNTAEEKTVSIEAQTPFRLENKAKKTIFYVVSFIMSLLIHFVFYGIMNWMPNLLAENFHVENSVGILISILAPIATVVGPIIAIFHCERHKNFIVVGLIYMIIAMVLVFALIFTYNLNIILCVALSVVFLVIVQGVITMIFSVVSIKMGAYVNTGAHASLMNAAGGFSAGFAPTIVGAIIDSTGWQISYVILTIVCIAVVISLAIIQLLIKSRKS